MLFNMISYCVLERNEKRMSKFLYNCPSFSILRPFLISKQAAKISSSAFNKTQHILLVCSALPTNELLTLAAKTS